MKHEVEDLGAVGTRDRATTSGSARPTPEQQEMQKKVEAAGTPGPGQKALESFLGNWKAEVKCWMEPGGAPNVSQGSSKASWIMNGRFLEDEFQGEMMGKPFKGRTTMGYDNMKQTFNTVWICDMATSMFTSEGKGDSGNKVITLEGKSTCPATGQKDVPMRTIYRVLSPDKYVFEMYDRSKGDAKTMEITFTRR